MKIAGREFKEKGIIREPIDPLFLELIGELDLSKEFGAVPGPDAPWSQTYHIFCNQGSWDRNYSMGLLHLEAPQGIRLDGRWTLKGKRLLYDGTNSHRSGSGFAGEAAVDRFDFQMTIHQGIPEQWKTRQVIVPYYGAQSGTELEKTRLVKSGRIESGSAMIRIGRVEKRIPLPEARQIHTTASALACAPLWPFEKSFSEKICILDDLAIPKKDGLVYYNGPSGELSDLKLHTFVIQARGELPFDFWLDEQHRLIACVMGSFGLAYVPIELSKSSFRPFLQKEFDRPVQI